MKDTANQSEVTLSSFYLVLTGWTYVEEETSVQCSYCNRKWSLEAHLNSSNPEDAINSTPVNAVAQHQRWCAWRREAGGWQSRLRQLQQVRDSQNQQRLSRLQSPEYVTIIFHLTVIVLF